MRARFEKVREPNGSFTAYERVEPEFPFNWHYHPEFELTLIVDSEGQRLVGETLCDYKPGDLVLLGPNLPHSYRSWPASAGGAQAQRAIVIQFSKESFGATLLDLPEMSSVASMLKRSAMGLVFGETKTGKDVESRLRQLPSLPSARRIASYCQYWWNSPKKLGRNNCDRDAAAPVQG